MNSYYGCVWFFPKTIYALIEIFRELTLCSSIGIPFWQNGGITAFAL